MSSTRTRAGGAARPPREPRGPAGACVDLAERIRIDEAIFGQAWIRNARGGGAAGRGPVPRARQGGAARRAQPRARAAGVRTCWACGGDPPDAGALRDPVRALPHRYKQLVRARLAGRPADDGLGNLALTTMGRAQLDRLGEAAGRVRGRGRPGRLRRGRCRRRGRGDPAAGDARGARGRRPLRLAGRPVLGHVAGRTMPTTARRPSCRRRCGGWPATSTRCGTASPGSGCSTTGCGSCTGRPADTLADAPIGQLALLRLGQGSGADAATALEHPPSPAVAGRAR